MKSLEVENYGFKKLSFQDVHSTYGGRNIIWEGVKNLCKAVYVGGRDFIDGFNSVDCESRK